MAMAVPAILHPTTMHLLPFPQLLMDSPVMNGVLWSSAVGGEMTLNVMAAATSSIKTTVCRTVPLWSWLATAGG